MKICYIDVETTGLIAGENDIIQIASIIEIDGRVMETFCATCRPYDPQNINQHALNVNGQTRAAIMRYNAPQVVLSQFEEVLCRYVDRFNKDKFIFAGYNANFDLGFVKAWFKKGGNPSFSDYFTYKVFDVYPLFFMYAKVKNLSLPNHRLETAAKYFKIPLRAHDALEDITATRILSLRLMAIFELGIAQEKNTTKKELGL